MECAKEDFELQTLLNLDGQSFWRGKYWFKFQAKRVEISEYRPHGIKYSITLHDRNNTRILGFDNAHQIKKRGRRPKKYTGRIVTWDHVHSCQKVEYYTFISTSQLLQDFWDAVNEIVGD
jgi:Family of unknown function (DUF6516)